MACLHTLREVGYMEKGCLERGRGLRIKLFWARGGNLP